MNLDDLKDKIRTEAQVIWEKVQESSLFNQLRDRYENLSPASQKLSILGGVTLLMLIILSLPYSNLNLSSESVSDFEGKRRTIRELLKVTRDANEVPNIPQAPPLESIRMQIEEAIKSANLLPEQIRGTLSSNDISNILPQNLVSGALEVKLAKLNLRQVLDLGFRFQNISTSVKMKDMSLTANMEDNRYLDVTYQLVALAVPALAENLPDESDFNPRDKFKKKKSSNVDSEE